MDNITMLTATTTGMIDSNSGRWDSLSGYINPETKNGTAQEINPNKPTLRYFLIILRSLHMDVYALHGLLDVTMHC